MDHRLCAVAALFLLTGCGGCEPTPKVIPVGEASPEAACANLRAQKCPEANPANMTCEQSLTKLLEVGTITAPRLSCISGAKDAQGLADCKVKCSR